MSEATDGTIELAKTAVGSVTMCGCGVVSVHLAGVSLRMETTAFAEVEAMLRSAMETLCALAWRRRAEAAGSGLTN